MRSFTRCWRLRRVLPKSQNQPTHTDGWSEAGNSMFTTTGRLMFQQRASSARSRPVGSSKANSAQGGLAADCYRVTLQFENQRRRIIENEVHARDTSFNQKTNKRKRPLWLTT